MSTKEKDKDVELQIKVAAFKQGLKDAGIDIEVNGNLYDLPPGVIENIQNCQDEKAAYAYGQAYGQLMSLQRDKEYGMGI